jgi:LuxR family maltose regulon positive regulatory protein
VARHTAGDAEGAARDLLQVLGPAIAEGNRRVFLDLGQWLVPVLQRAMRMSRDELLGSLTSEFLGGLLDELRLAEGRSHSGAPPLFSRREHEVLVELAHGLSNKEIARALNLTENTVKFHLKSIFAKLEVDRRSQAIAVAQARRLI